MRRSDARQTLQCALPVSAFLLLAWTPLTAQVDPGPRPGPANAGGPLTGLSTNEGTFFSSGQDDFAQPQSVQGQLAGQPDTNNTGGGLGPRFNSDSCGSCHAQPATGGSSPSPASPQATGNNPQFTVGQKNGGTNVIPSFVHVDGPVREARFKYNADGTRDGGVHDLFVITGRKDAGGCTIKQPDFTAAAAHNNLIFRIPTPVFGAGLVEAITDSTIVANMNANLPLKRGLGISGHPNHNGNDGTITRFGWKAQNKSLELFAGEAYNVEQGVTNEIFTTERDETPGCLFNGTPEDHTNFDAATPVDTVSDIVKFVNFMRFLAPPAPVTSYGSVSASSIANGQKLFTSSAVGCAMCHTPSLAVGTSSSQAITKQVQANLFSDLLVHHMGGQMADNILQGQAGPDEFRTAPLWGLGQRIFFLHDGRTSDLLEAIHAHADGPGCVEENRFGFSLGFHSGCGSEADKVISNFNALSNSDKQDILNFLRSL